MNSLVLLIVCVAILGIGYVCYGGWLCKQWGRRRKQNRDTGSYNGRRC